MNRNKIYVVSVLAATFFLLPTGLWAEGKACSGEHSKNCLRGSFIEQVHAGGRTFTALITFSPGGGAVETNNAQGQPVTVHGSWAAAGDDHFALTFWTLGLQPMNWDTTPPTPLAPGGRAKTRETIILSDSGDSFTAVFVVEEMDPQGNVIGILPGTAEGQRIFVEPLSN